MAVVAEPEAKARPYAPPSSRDARVLSNAFLFGLALREYSKPYQQIRQQRTTDKMMILAAKGPHQGAETYLMVSGTILLVRGAQGNRGNDRASAGIWVRSNVYSPSAKAINDMLIGLFELCLFVDG